MKRVRFESPIKSSTSAVMNDFECQSPRPFMEKKITPILLDTYDIAKVLPFSNDPIERYECGNGSPYPMVNKTCLTNQSKIESKWTPSNDLELSLLDSFGQKLSMRSNLQDLNMCNHLNQYGSVTAGKNVTCYNIETKSRVLSSLENKSPNPPNVINKYDDFFLRREDLHKISLGSHSNKSSFEKENNPISAKSELMKINIQQSPTPASSVNKEKSTHPDIFTNNHCKCHNCIVTKMNNPSCHMFSRGACFQNILPINSSSDFGQCCLQETPNNYIHCECNYSICNRFKKKCPCECIQTLRNNINTVDKKTWALKMYEESKDIEKVNVENQGSKEKREPTVADLFKIIKIQNEQLQLLQDKVDKFISGSKFESKKQPLSLKDCTTEHVAMETVDEKHHKISIGVMTSFEVVRTSTIINKEIVKQNGEAQVQCNRSQISIKEVQPINLNFLDGIAPVAHNNNNEERNNMSFLENNQLHHTSDTLHKDNMNEDKTLNEMSLYNIKVDNATTPLMSPEQSLYLDVRDYSDSESDTDDQSNVGWTYYNKVMTHVNGMLHDSDMPSSASALYRNTRQKCMQMKIDKTNVSVIKRVKFGDEPIGIQQQHIAASSDTSLKMNQLAAKYLKHASLQAPLGVSYMPTAAPIDMSFATRNYMEKHQLLQGLPEKSNSIPAVEIPRFLDITALKQQPKLL